MSKCRSNNISNFFGIINFSNNCYLNVIIQLFLSNKETSNLIAHHLDFERNVQRKLQLFDKNEESYKTNQECILRIINPKKLLMCLSEKMNVSRQNDSQEAFTQLLDLIPELEKHFITKIINTYKCLECNQTRETKDKFSTFYIHGDSIEASVKEFLKQEKFELECEHCKKNTETIKTCKIKKLANVLVFFNVTKQKINFTENISYSGREYNLTGIIKHYGTERYGHYIYIDFINKLVMDDTNIRKVDGLDLDNIYLLFYTC